MARLRYKTFFIYYVLGTVIQPCRLHPGVANIGDDTPAARSHVQELMQSSNHEVPHVQELQSSNNDLPYVQELLQSNNNEAPQSSKPTSLNSRKPGVTIDWKDFKVDISAIYSRALLKTSTSTLDYSTSRPTQRSKLASNLYFDEKVPMYRIPTEIVYRYGSPTEIRYRSKLPRNTWTIYSQQGSSTSDVVPSITLRKKRQVTTPTSPMPRANTWTEILFRQGSPTEIRYHTRRDRSWSVFSQQPTTLANSTREKRQALNTHQNFSSG